MRSSGDFWQRVSLELLDAFAWLTDRARSRPTVRIQLAGPSVHREVRDLIRQMNRANPLWGAPRIPGELLKLGIEVGQATVAKYMVRRAGTPSPTWRSFLRNEAIGIAAIDMFVAVSASFRLLLRHAEGFCDSILPSIPR